MYVSKKTYRIIAVIFILFVLSVFITGCSTFKVKRFLKSCALFDKEDIVGNFRNMHSFINYNEIEKGGEVFNFGSKPTDLPEFFIYKDEKINIQQLLDRTWTTGFIVIKDDDILYEKYYRGNTKEALNISWSVGKSFVSALIGIAVEEGKIKDINEPVTTYAPELKTSGYNGVSIKNVLEMSSGVGFDENYGSFFSDINRMGRAIALGSSINEFASSLKPERKQGTYNHYVSMDTQVLGMVLQNATDTSVSKYLEEKIWKKIGMQSNAKWLIDDTGMELVFGTLNATLRDYARFGRLYQNYGNWDGQQIVPAQWVLSSTTPTAQHLLPGDNPFSGERFGYGYQWWVPEHPNGDFMALGVYGQCIYVNPPKGIVIVKNSAYPKWVEDKESDYELIALYQYLSGVL